MTEFGLFIYLFGLHEYKTVKMSSIVVTAINEV